MSEKHQKHVGKKRLKSNREMSKKCRNAQKTTSTTSESLINIQKNSGKYFKYVIKQQEQETIQQNA